MARSFLTFKIMYYDKIKEHCSLVNYRFTVKSADAHRIYTGSALSQEVISDKNHDRYWSCHHKKGC